MTMTACAAFGRMVLETKTRPRRRSVNANEGAVKLGLAVTAGGQASR